MVETLLEKRARLLRYTHTYRKKHPDRVKQIRKRIYDRRKLKAILMVGEPKCVRCGCDIIQFLEFNHKNGGGCKEYRESGGSAPMERLLTNKLSPKGLEILCRICNALDFLERKNPIESKRFKIIWK